MRLGHLLSLWTLHLITILIHRLSSDVFSTHENKDKAYLLPVLVFMLTACKMLLRLSRASVRQLLVEVYWWVRLPKISDYRLTKFGKLQCSICNKFQHAQCYGYRVAPPTAEFVCYSCLLEGEDTLMSEMRVLCIKRRALYHLQDGHPVSGKDMVVHLSKCSQVIADGPIW